LEQTKRRLAKELEGDKEKYMEELETHKNTLAEQLDTKRQTLSHELAIKKAEVERRLAQLDQAAETASTYRHVVGLLRSGQYEADEIEELQKKMTLTRGQFPPGSEIYKAWSTFYQRGYNLNERARAVKAARARRAAWNDKADPSSPATLGLN